ncbi:MAG: Fe-S cluster assembly protein SufB [Candidatus Woesearchaeota archaeon]
MSDDIREINRELYDTPSNLKYKYKAPEGLSEDVIRKISSDNEEPEWMLQLRLDAYEQFKKLSMPSWGPSLDELDLNKIVYYQHPDAPYNQKSWDDVPDEVKETFEKLGIPEAERAALAGAGAQMESKMAYHNLKEEWEKKGVIFLDMDEALKKHPELVKKYFSKVVPINDHKFAALHYAVWSGGTFLYIPKGVHVDKPLQAYFRMNSMRAGQFEHTLIIAEENSFGSYYEGCSAPKYDDKSLHAGCVEVHVLANARFRYSSVENWSANTYNLNTKRGIVYKDSTLEWIGGSLGSGVTMLYPCSMLVGEGSRAEHLAIAFASKGQNQDTGAKVYHNAPRTTSRIVSKSIAIKGGITAYRGLLRIAKGAKGAKSNVECDALMIDNKSQSNTYPYIDILEQDVDVGHEATVGRISDEQVFYLTSRGIPEEEAVAMLVNGFMEPITKELPIEYAVEMNKLIELEMEGSIG